MRNGNCNSDRPTEHPTIYIFSSNVRKTFHVCQIIMIICMKIYTFSPITQKPSGAETGRQSKLVHNFGVCRGSLRLNILCGRISFMVFFGMDFCKMYIHVLCFDYVVKPDDRLKPQAINLIEIMLNFWFESAMFGFDL